MVSLAMSAVQALMLKHGIDPTRVGRCGKVWPHACCHLPALSAQHTADK